MNTSKAQPRTSQETGAPAQQTASIPSTQTFVFDAAMDTIVAVSRQTASKQHEG